MRFSIILLSLVGTTGTYAFISNVPFSDRSSQYASSVVERCMVSAPGGDSAKAFTEYMAKSHEEKLKALKDLEDKKNTEIKALKEELEKAKSVAGGNIVQASTPPAPALIVHGSIEDLSAKLLSYQKFMSEYVVKAHQEKYNAVRAAEAAIIKKYEEKLNTLMLTGSQAAGIESGGQSKLFQERNAKIAAAAVAGKSRWGDKEIQKVTGIKMNKSISSPHPVSSRAPSLENIAAADHGLRADGGVGGLTLAERVLEGSTANTVLKPVNGVAVLSTQSSLFAMRNAKIAQAAKAGKQSRWGVKEQQRAVEVTAALPSATSRKPIVVTPEIAAADHGLRADGGVSGPTLAERVNLGAQLLQKIKL